MASPFIELEVGERVVKLTNPDKVLFPTRGKTKLDLAEYYIAVGDGIVRALYERPTQLRRFPDGVTGEKIYQKRCPKKRPDWVETAQGDVSLGAHADELCVTELAARRLGGAISTRRLPPWHSRRGDTEHPDELRIDLDPQPGTDFARRRRGRRARPRGARRARLRRLAEDLRQPRHPRLRAGSSRTGSSPRSAGRRSRSPARSSGALPKHVTTAWWKEERGERVFLDYNQNARDRTIASAYSVRATPDAPVSAPVTWDEVPTSRPRTSPSRRCRRASRSCGDVHAGIDDAVCDLARAAGVGRARRAGRGLGEAPYPPKFPKMPGEPMRVQPSRARKSDEPARCWSCPSQDTSVELACLRDAHTRDDATDGHRVARERDTLAPTFELRPRVASEDLDYVARNKAAWERWAPQYSAAGRETWAEDELRWGIWGLRETEAQLLDGLAPGADIVELGCGTASISGWLARRGFHPVGVDIARRQVETAARFASEFGARFPLVCANAEQLHYDAENFDCRSRTRGELR